MTNHLKKSPTWGQQATDYMGEKVRQIRQLRKLTVSELSQLTEQAGYEIPKNSITNLELGRKSTVSVQDLLILAQCLDIPLSYFLPDRPERQAAEQITFLHLDAQEMWQELVSKLVDLERTRDSMFLRPGSNPSMNQEVKHHWQRIIKDYSPEETSLWAALTEAVSRLSENQEDNSAAHNPSELITQRFGVTKKDNDNA